MIGCCAVAREQRIIDTTRHSSEWKWKAASEREKIKSKTSGRHSMWRWLQTAETTVRSPSSKLLFFYFGLLLAMHPFRYIFGAFFSTNNPPAPLLLLSRFNRSLFFIMIFVTHGTQPTIICVVISFFCCMTLWRGRSLSICTNLIVINLSEIYIAQFYLDRLLYSNRVWQFGHKSTLLHTHTHVGTCWLVQPYSAGQSRNEKRVLNACARATRFVDYRASMTAFCWFVVCGGFCCWCCTAS